MAGEARLLKASLKGDHDAFARIVRRYQALVCAITYSATGDLATSEDLAQETFLAAWKGLGSLREPSRLRAWLCAIARNLTADYLRRHQHDVAAGAASVEDGPAVHLHFDDQVQLVHEVAARGREQVLLGLNVILALALVLDGHQGPPGELVDGPDRVAHGQIERPLAIANQSVAHGEVVDPRVRLAHPFLRKNRQQ